MAAELVSKMLVGHITLKRLATQLAFGMNAPLFSFDFARAVMTQEAMDIAVLGYQSV